MGTSSGKCRVDNSRSDFPPLVDGLVDKAVRPPHSLSSQFTTRYDPGLKHIEHYQKYPQMMPFVGSEYGGYGPKILLIAESHYLCRNSTIHLEPMEWYSSTAGQLLDHELSSTCTRKCLTKTGPTWKSKAYTIYRNLEAALLEAGYPAADNTLRHVAFMNGFQRPAVSRLSIEATPVDQEHSVKTIQGVIDAIEPEYIIFISQKAHRALGYHLGVQTRSVPHPASAWWNRSSKRGTGKGQFVELLRSLLKNK